MLFEEGGLPPSSCPGADTRARSCRPNGLRQSGRHGFAREFVQRAGHFLQYRIATFDAVSLLQVHRVVISEPGLTLRVLPNQGLLWQVDGHSMSAVHQRRTQLRIPEQQ